MKVKTALSYRGEGGGGGREEEEEEEGKTSSKFIPTSNYCRGSRPNPSRSSDGQRRRQRRRPGPDMRVRRRCRPAATATSTTAITGRPTPADATTACTATVAACAGARPFVLFERDNVVGVGLSIVVRHKDGRRLLQVGRRVVQQIVPWTARRDQRIFLADAMLAHRDLAREDVLHPVGIRLRVERVCAVQRVACKVAPAAVKRCVCPAECTVEPLVRDCGNGVACRSMPISRCC